MQLLGENVSMEGWHNLCYYNFFNQDCRISWRMFECMSLQ